VSEIDINVKLDKELGKTSASQNRLCKKKELDFLD
jgi:hypothetical protein